MGNGGEEGGEREEGGGRREGEREGRQTVQFSQNAIHGPGAAAAGHLDVEFVGVV